MEDSIIFSDKTLLQLRKRITEIEREIENDKNSFVDLKKKKKQLDKERKIKEDAIKDQLERCEELQMLKFGRLVDMNAVDCMPVSTSHENTVQTKFSAVNLQYENKASAQQKQRYTLSEELLAVTSENTTILKEIAQLSERQMLLERELNSGSTWEGGQIAIKKTVSLKEEKKEEEKMRSLIESYAIEIAALQAELTLLKRKEGHIYVPKSMAL
mmetsp:Transcript_13436/g.19576  ORF Transcript_13436/g.19576 Transcript_13436/m.19576 type:complete len:214 (+) Transcript_13436:84-725(+)